MQTFLTLPHEHEASLPNWADADADIRLPDALAEVVIAECSAPGDAVLDPFAGFGTTLVVAEALGREGYGIEYDDRRAAYVSKRLDHPDRLVAGDAFAVDRDHFPAVDLLFTSPPYMVEGMDANPFENYEGETDYDAYLQDMGTLFERFKPTLASDATVVVEVSNMTFLGDVTTLAWDVGGVLRDVFDFRGEVVVGWEGDHDGAGRADADANGTYAYGYDHSYCLLFDANG